MVKNRAEKQNARAIKARTGLTYPRAQARLRAGHELQLPALFLGYGTDGGNIVHRPGRGKILVVGGGTGTGKSLLLSRLAAEASGAIPVYVIDAAKYGSDYQAIRGQLTAIETTAAGALARVKSLAEPEHSASLLVIDEIAYADDIPGFREALWALSDSGVSIIIGGQVPHRSLPAALMARADRMILGDTTYGDRLAMFRNPDAPVLGGRHKAILETTAGSVQVILPPGGVVPKPDCRFEFGTDAVGAPAAFTPARDLHLLVTGCPGAGKTWFLRALATDAVKSMDVYVSSTSPHAESELRVPWAAMTATSLEATADMLHEIMREINVRNARRHRESVSRAADLRDAPRPILIVLDEFYSLIHNDPMATAAECTPEDRNARARIAVAVGKLAREGRTAGVSLVIAGHSTELQLIPGAGDFKVSLSRLVLGRLDGGFQDLTADLRDPALRALRPASRQGIYAPLSGDGGLVDIILP